MVDPTKVTNFNRSRAELEEYLLFCISVAGKTAKQISVALDKFLNYGKDTIIADELYRFNGRKATPFEYIRNLDRVSPGLLEDAIKAAKLGQHTKLYKAFYQIAHSGLDLSTCSVDDLEAIHGIGSKTARYFLIHTRPNQKLACLDTHVLKYMSDTLGVRTPKASPSGRKYRELEKLFIDHAIALDKDIAEFDLEIWNKYSTRSGSG